MGNRANLWAWGRPAAIALAIRTYHRPRWPWPTHGAAWITGALMLVVAGLLLQSCDDGLQEIRIVAQEYRFEPSEIRRSAGRPLTLVLANRGREAHEFTSLLLRDPRVEIIRGPESVRRRESDSLRLLPGRNARVTLMAPPGSYAFHCRIRGHAGMQGLITLH